VTHYASDGWLLHKSSEDARKQLELEKTEAEAAARFQAEVDRALKEKVITPATYQSCCCSVLHHDLRQIINLPILAEGLSQRSMSVGPKKAS
jgi:hypothetical protein